MHSLSLSTSIFIMVIFSSPEPKARELFLSSLSICCCFCKIFIFFSSNKRIFHSFGDVTITCEGLYSALMAIKQRGFFSMPHLLWHRASFNEGCLGGSVPCTRDAVTTCYTDLGLLQLGLEHPTFCMRHERFNWLPHHGFFHLLKNNYSNFKQTWHKTSLS